MKAKIKKNSGFIGMVFLAVVFIGICVAAISAMSRQSFTGTHQEKMRMDAAVIIKQGSDFRIALEKIIVTGAGPWVNIKNVNNVPTFVDYPEMNKEIAFRPPLTAVPEDRPFYSVTNHGVGSGGATVYQRYLSLRLRSKEHCQMINKLVHGRSLSAEPVRSVTLIEGGEECYYEFRQGDYVYVKYILENVTEPRPADVL